MRNPCTNLVNSNSFLKFVTQSLFACGAQQLEHDNKVDSLTQTCFTPEFTNFSPILSDVHNSACTIPVIPNTIKEFNPNVIRRTVYKVKVNKEHVYGDRYAALCSMRMHRVLI